MMRALGSEGDIARGLINLAQLARDRGDLVRAAPLAAESLILSRKNGHARNTAYALLCAADVSRDQGDRASARVRYTEALTAFHVAGNPLGVTEAIERLGFLAAQEGRAERGARLLGYSDRMRAHMGTPIPPNARAEHARAQAALHDALDDGALAAAWAAGGALSTDVAIAEAAAAPAAPTATGPTDAGPTPMRRAAVSLAQPDDQTAASQ
jgi:non-specific serine/threonine protein kinase